MRAFLLVLLLCPGMARALNTWGTDMSDLWWNPAESGWGLNVSHQLDVIFATLFVYGSDNRTRWYVAPALAYTGSTNGAYVFNGTLYETQGPFLGGAFNPNAVTSRAVGPIRLTFPGINRAELSYTVDGVSVNKILERQTFRRAELTGTYYGAFLARVSGCIGAGTIQTAGVFNVTLDANSTVTANSVLDNGARCSYSGTYYQDGRMGEIVGTFACTGSTPTAGTFGAFEIEAGYGGIMFRYEARYGTCVEQGQMGGMRPDL